LFFQWNPVLNDWGNDTEAIAWGHATSYNLIDWDFDDTPALLPSDSYDDKGVFTGGFIPSTLSSNTTTFGSNLVLAYTSVKREGVTFKKPYLIGTETLSLAQSSDNGATWQKYEGNPIISGAPTPDYTGWRDPYISYWPAADNFLGNNSQSLYALISGGFRNQGPTTFVYKLDSTDLTTWDYIGPLINIESNTREGRWTGDVGKNWECVNRMSLKDPNGDLEREFLIISAEGTNPNRAGNGSSTAAEALMVARTPRYQLWMTGDLTKSPNSSIAFTPLASGIFDHGNFYAANSFRHPLTDKLLVWGWVQEEDLPNDIRAAQGWSGIISSPRELYLQVHRNVIGYLGGDDLSKIPVFEPLESRDDNNVTYSTMGIKSHQGVLQGLKARAVANQTLDRWSPNTTNGTDSYKHDIAINDTAHIIIQTSVRYSSLNATSVVGVSIIHDEVQDLHTDISFDPVNQTVTIDRSHTVSSTASAVDKTINRRPESAAHTLLTYSSLGDKSMETLDFVILFDKSILEVFVNERTVISTRIYVNGNSTRGSVRLSAEGANGQEIAFERTGVWCGMDAEMRY
jgi:beta-fructofuranosidase